MLLPRGSCRTLSSRHAAKQCESTVSVLCQSGARPLQNRCSHSTSRLLAAGPLQHGPSPASTAATHAGPTAAQTSLKLHDSQHDLLYSARKQRSVRHVQVHVASSNGLNAASDQQQQPLTVASASISSATAATTSSPAGSSSASSSTSQSSSSFDANDAAAVSTLVAEAETHHGDSAGASASIPDETAVLACDDSGLSPSDSADDLCQVDEVDTPEGLTDLNYAAPSSPSGERRYRSGYVPGRWLVKNSK